MKVFLLMMGILLVVFFLLLVTLGTIVYRFLSKANKTQFMEERIVGSGDKKCLFIYHDSPHNSVSKIVEEQIPVLNQMGYEVTINKPNEELKYDLTKYDLFIFGSPTFFGKPSNVLGKFMLNNLVENKKIILFTVGSIINDEKDLDTLEFFTDYSDTLLRCKCLKNDPSKLTDLIKKIEDKGLKTRGYHKYYEEKEKYESRNTVNDKKRK